MSSSNDQPRALYRFDPHDEGIWLGLGLIRLSMVCGSMLLGALSVYGGQILLALLLLLVVPPLVLARWDGLPLLAWIPLRALYRLQGPQEWALDPEHVGFVTPLLSVVPAVEGSHLLDEDELDDGGLDEADDLGDLTRAQDAQNPDSDGDLLW